MRLQRLQRRGRRRRAGYSESLGAAAEPGGAWRLRHCAGEGAAGGQHSDARGGVHPWPAGERVWRGCCRRPRWELRVPCLAR